MLLLEQRIKLMSCPLARERGQHSVTLTNNFLTYCGARKGWLACPTNHGCGIETQVSDSGFGSTAWKLLAPQPCYLPLSRPVAFLSFTPMLSNDLHGELHSRHFPPVSPPLSANYYQLSRSFMCRF